MARKVVKCSQAGFCRRDVLRRDVLDWAIAGIGITNRILLLEESFGCFFTPFEIGRTFIFFGPFAQSHGTHPVGDKFLRCDPEAYKFTIDAQRNIWGNRYWASGRCQEIEFQWILGTPLATNRAQRTIEA